MVEMPLSRMRLGIAKILKEEGFIQGYQVVREDDFQRLRLYLRYVNQERPVITGLRRISRPGLRIYVGKDKIPSVRRGLGIAILSTSQGLMTDKESRRKQIGGEVLCHVW